MHAGYVTTGFDLLAVVLAFDNYNDGRNPRSGRTKTARMIRRGFVRRCRSGDWLLTTAKTCCVINVPMLQQSEI